MKTPKPFDKFIWLGLILLAALCAFLMLKRDANRQFGAVSYGAFPAFHLSQSNGGVIDHHWLKGKVWVIHSAKTTQAAMLMANQLYDLAQQTASGKRRFYLLTLEQEAVGQLHSLGAQHFIAQSDQALLKKLEDMMVLEKGEGIILVDQNGIIRGYYGLNHEFSKAAYGSGNFSSVDEFRRFAQDVRSLL